MIPRDEFLPSPRIASDAAPGVGLPAEGDRSQRSPNPDGAIETSPFSFSLASLLLIVVLVAVCLRITLAIPGLGIFLGVTGVVAGVRTFTYAQRRRRQGTSLSIHEKCTDLFQSHCTVWFSVGAAALAAVPFGMVAACQSTLMYAVLRWPNPHVWEAIALGAAGLATLGVFVRTLRALWPHGPQVQFHSRPHAPAKTCPVCQSSISAFATSCWVCEQRIAPPKRAAAAGVAPVKPNSTAGREIVSAFLFAVAAAAAAYLPLCLVAVAATAIHCDMSGFQAAGGVVPVFLAIGYSGLAAIGVFGWAFLIRWRQPVTAPPESTPRTLHMLCPVCQASISAEAKSCWLCDLRQTSPIHAKATGETAVAATQSFRQGS